MPLISMWSPASSLEASPAEEPLQALISEELQKLPTGVHVDLGPALPVYYEVNRLVLMVQDPFHVFAYWEVTDDLRSRVLSSYPQDDWADFQMVLEWRDVVSDHQVTFDLGSLSCWWFETTPDSRYQAQLGLYSELYGTVTLLKSNIVETPKYGLGPDQLPTRGEQEAEDRLDHVPEPPVAVGPESAVEPALAQVEEPTQVTSGLEEKTDKAPSDGPARVNLPEMAATRSDPLPCRWPSSW